MAELPGSHSTEEGALVIDYERFNQETAAAVKELEARREAKRLGKKRKDTGNRVRHLIENNEPDGAINPDKAA